MILFLISSFIFVSASFSTDRLIDVRYEQLTKDAKKQIDCLADNIYHEAGYEPDQGKIAVALVTMNRVQDPRYPKDICSVVKQKVKYTCQFTWFCQDKYTNRHHPLLIVAISIACSSENTGTAFDLCIVPIPLMAEPV